MENENVLTNFKRACRKGFFFLVALASFLLLSVNLPFEVRIAPNLFFLIHTLLESSGIVIAAMIFVIAWAPLEEKRSIRHTILTGAFLSLCIMEMAHLVTFDGTFAQSLDNAKANSFKLALAAQSFMALGLLSYAFCPTHSISKRTANIALGLFTLVSAAIIAYIFNTTDSTSTVLNSAKGPSAAAIGFELCIGGLYLVAGLKLYQHSKLTKHFPSMRFAVAAVMLAMSVFLFSKYFHVLELNSLVGYFYKMNAYALIFRALVINNIEQPYQHIRELKLRFESTLDALPDLVFETSREGMIYEYHSDPARGNLINSPQDFVGHNLSEFLSPEATKACMMALEESSLNGKSYGQQYSLAQPDGEHHYEISASELIDANDEKHYLMIVRDISARHSLTQRLEALLLLSEKSEGLEEQAIAQMGLETLERLTKSKLSFLHYLSVDENDIEPFVWGRTTDPSYFRIELEHNKSLGRIGVWTETLRARKAVIINDRVSGHSGVRPELKRYLSVPIFEGVHIRMVIGVGNPEHLYSENVASSVELFGKELYQILKRRHAQSQSEKNRHLLTAALENLPVGIAITTTGENIKFEYFNKQFPKLYDVDPSLITNFDSFWDAAIEDKSLRQQMKRKMTEDVASGDLLRMRWEQIPIERNGKIQRYLNVQTVPVANSALSVTLVEDVTEAMRKEEEIRIAATAFSSQEGQLITDANMCILRVNKAFERSSGYRANELIGQTPAFLQSEDQDPEFYKQICEILGESGIWRGDVWNKTKKGKLAPYSLSISAVTNTLQIVTHFVATYIDISDIKNAQETINRLSYFDTLTGLPNREHIKNILTDQALLSSDSGEFNGALMIGLDNFKTINETLGQESGDLLLLQVAKRLKTLLRPGDQVARYGGDEFLILLMNLGESAESASLKTQLIAKSFANILEDSHWIGNRNYFSTASIGATLFRIGQQGTHELFKQLDIALSSAKREDNSSIRFFDPAWQASATKRARLLEDLRIAIKEQQLELFYQPQFNDHGEIVGAEGLIRWNHPSRGLLPPIKFLPLAEENRLMIKLGDEVLRIGLAQLHQWQAHSSFRHLKLSLNITADQFYEDRFEKVLLAYLNDLAITPGSLMLEFTESMVIGRIDEAREKIIRLIAADIEFAIDDFGTGYSSLSYLSTLPMNQLKIDKSFVSNIGHIETDTQIVTAIINMAHILKLDVIAEGVETQPQLDFLKAQNCLLYQGYIFSKPVPIAAFNQLVLDAETRKG